MQNEPTYDECMEALEVIYERYGMYRTLGMLETVQANARAEQKAKDDAEIAGANE